MALVIFCFCKKKNVFVVCIYFVDLFGQMFGRVVTSAADDVTPRGTNCCSSRDFFLMIIYLFCFCIIIIFLVTVKSHAGNQRHLSSSMKWKVVVAAAACGSCGLPGGRM